MYLDINYILLNPLAIIFTYQLIDENKNTIKKLKINRSISFKKNIQGYNFIGYNLPTTMDFTT